MNLIYVLEISRFKIAHLYFRKAARQGHPISITLGETKSISRLIAITDCIFLKLGDSTFPVTEALATGELTLRQRICKPEFKVLLSEETKEQFVACAVYESATGGLMGLTIDSNRRLQVITIPVEDRLLRKIYRKQISQFSNPVAPSAPGSPPPGNCSDPENLSQV